jgi:predicted dehydrogenase
MLRVAVLGAGRIGTIHAANIAADRRTKLVVVADPYKNAEELAKQLGCETSLDCPAAIEREDVDAVLIGTPTDTHVDLMLRAVKLGKPVLCEKPIDLDIERERAAVALVEKVNGRVMLAFNRRFDLTPCACARPLTTAGGRCPWSSSAGPRLTTRVPAFRLLLSRQHDPRLRHRPVDAR